MARRTKARTPRTPLSRERVLRAAITLADEGGIKALSMRKLAQELGVEAMSLYNHVANKDDILDGIVDVVASEIELPLDGARLEDGPTSQRRSRSTMFSCATPGRPASGCRVGGSVRRACDYMDVVLRSLREARLLEGPDLPRVSHPGEPRPGFHAPAAELSRSTRSELAGACGALPPGLPADEYPDLAEHVKQHMEPPGTDDAGAFEFGLDLILDGLEGSGHGLTPLDQPRG